MKHLSHVTRNGQEELHQRRQYLVSPNPEHEETKDKANISINNEVSFMPIIFCLGTSQICH